MNQSINFAEKICNFIYILLKYLLAIGLTAIMCIPAIYHLSNQNTHHVQNRSLYKSFHTTPHQSIKQKLDKSAAAYLYGKQPQEIEHFVDYYAQQQTLEGWRVVKWQFDADADLTDYVPVNDIKMELQKYIDVEQERKTIWVISMNGYREKFPQVRELMRRYPSDRFIVIAQKKQKIANFEFFQIPEISMKDFENALKQHLGINNKQANILIKHYGSIHKTMEQIDNQCRQLQCVLGDNYHDISLLSSSQMKKMNTMCANGVYQSQKQIKALDKSGAFFHEQKYYWKNIQSALNFQIQTQNPKTCKFIDSQLMFWQIPGVLFEDPSQQQDQIQDKDGLTDQQQEEYEGWFEDKQHQQEQQNDQNEQKKINEVNKQIDNDQEVHQDNNNQNEDHQESNNQDENNQEENNQEDEQNYQQEIMNTQNNNDDENNQNNNQNNKNNEVNNKNNNQNQEQNNNQQDNNPNDNTGNDNDQLPSVIQSQIHQKYQDKTINSQQQQQQQKTISDENSKQQIPSNQQNNIDTKQIIQTNDQSNNQQQKPIIEEKKEEQKQKQDQSQPNLQQEVSKSSTNQNSEKTEL